jgi:hypothetical protein
MHGRAAHLAFALGQEDRARGLYGLADLDLEEHVLRDVLGQPVADRHQASLPALASTHQDVGRTEVEEEITDHQGAQLGDSEAGGRARPRRWPSS